MTRFKKELKRKGFKFSEDYPYLPIEEGSHGVFIEDVDLNEEKDIFLKALMLHLSGST